VRTAISSVLVGDGLGGVRVLVQDLQNDNHCVRIVFVQCEGEYVAAQSCDRELEAFAEAGGKHSAEYVRGGGEEV
jgi:hypothetical protein